jgi:tRNA nucleotidyltransferase (CCA-adding enzyme)
MIALMGSPEIDLRSLPAAEPLFGALGAEAGAWVVGGAVRDLLLGAEPVDLDLAVEGDALAAAARLATALGGDLVVHERFGTASVSAGGRVYDVAGARAETYAHPGALPDVLPGTLAEDLRRRDFTVNAIAVALDGRVEAAAGAFEDLAARQLRVLHDASFLDDPTRLLRMVRYATRLGFSVEPGTAALAKAALASGALATVSPARIGGELRLLLREPSAGEALSWVSGWPLGVSLSFDAALAERALGLLPEDGRRDLLLLAVAVRGVPPDELSAWLDALELSAAERSVVVACAPTPGIEERALAASEIAARFRGEPVEAVALAGALGAAGPARRWLCELRHVRLEIDGSDLLAAGVPQGEGIGRGLAAALAAKLDGHAPDRAAQLEIALAAG